MNRFLLTLLLTAAALSSAFPAVPPPEKILPNDTLAMFTVPDYAASRKSWQTTPLGQLWRDPALKPFKDKFLTKLKKEVVEPLEKEFGVKFGDYSGLAQGQVTFALSRGQWGTEPDVGPDFLLLLDAREKADALKTVLADLKTRWIASGKQVKSEKIRDVEFTTLIFSSDDVSKTLQKVFPDPNEGWETLEAQKPKKPARRVEWLVGQSGSLMILGSSAKEVEKVLIRQGGGAVPALAEQPAFGRAYASQFREAGCYGWVDVQTLLAAALKPKPAENAPPRRGPMMSPEKLLAALGLSSVQTLTFTDQQRPDGSLFAANLAIPEAERRGLFKLFALERRDASPPPFVPAEAVKFSRIRLDLAKGITTLEAMLVEALPQVAGVIKLIVDNAGKDRDPNFDMRQQLFANLGNDIISYEKAPRTQTLAAMNAPPSLLLISSSKPQELAAALRSLSALAPQRASKVREREFLGRRVYSMQMPPLPGRGPAAPTERTLHFAASGDYVAMSTDVAMLEEYLRSNVSTARPLSETAGLREAAEKVGGMNNGVFGYENQRETTRTLLETVKKDSSTLGNVINSLPIAGRLGLNEDPNALKEWLDFSLLPPFDPIAKYFHFNVWSVSSDGEGLHFRVFSPRSPQLR